MAKQNKSAKANKGSSSAYVVDEREGGALSADLIVDAALEEIDLNGLDTFRIRALCNRLNVHPAAIYWHIGSKDLILSEVVARVTSKVLPIDSRLSWKERLRQLFGRYREAVRAHPNTAPLLGGTLIGNAKADFRFVETILAAVHDAGLRGGALVAGYNTIIAGLVGFVSEEFATEPLQNIDAWRQDIQDRLAQVSPDQFPVLAENLPALRNRAFILRWENGAGAPMTHAFAQFVDVILNGIEFMAQTEADRQMPAAI